MKNIFGNPDGSKTELNDILKDFIKFEYRCSGVNQGLMDDFEKTRVIIGTKGTGKTVYLRKMHAELRENRSVFTTDIQQDVPPTDLVIQFAQMCKAYNIEEEWTKVWRMAILRSICTYLLFPNKWSSECNDVSLSIIRE